MTSPNDFPDAGEIPVTCRVFSQLYREDWMSFARYEMSELERRARPYPDWQPVGTAPKEGVRILCSYLGNRPFIARWENDMEVFMDDFDAWRDVTHWMSIQPPPAIARAEGRAV